MIACAPNILRSVDFDERNLNEPVSVSDMAAAAAYSTFHFLRIFKALTGETPGSYLRRRRLAEAAGELVSGRRRIIEIAVECQLASWRRVWKLYFFLWRSYNRPFR